MRTILGILLWTVLATVQGFFFDQYRVFRLEDNMTNNVPDNNQEDVKTYFDAIRDTFDLYNRDKRYKNGTVCQSDMTQLDIGDKRNNFLKLKRNFGSKCSYVIGNVVIAHISDEDISFLDSIKEISGYLFVYHNTARSISLKSLEVIRGENALIIHPEKFSLIVESNYFRSEQLKYLILPNLQVILRNDVKISNSPGLCYMKMINWDSLTYGTQKVIIYEKKSNSCLINETEGGKTRCHPDCPVWAGKQFCWSNSRGSCQRINDCRTQKCSYEKHKCYTSPMSNIESCCHDECAGGCSGPSNKQCLACRNFTNDGICVEYCPRQIIYRNQKQIKNPEGKLAFHHVCVDKCPVKFFDEHGNCVLNCTTPYTYPVNETCMPCPNRICPKVCHAKDVIGKETTAILHRKMLYRLENCTIYDGNIIINMLSFEGDRFYSMNKEEYGIRNEDFKKLKSLQEIYGYVEIQMATHTKITSLSFLRNLKIIRANNIGANGKPGLSIVGNAYLMFLGLKRLVEVQNGDVVIRQNPKLCFVRTLNKRSFKHKGKIEIRSNCMRALNTTHYLPMDHKLNCSNQCDAKFGCWGPGKTLCVKCLNFITPNEVCVNNCSEMVGLFYENSSLTEKQERRCSECHSQCKKDPNTCFGPFANQCNHGCKKYSDKGSCVANCQSTHYPAPSECTACDPACLKTIRNGTVALCSGPGDFPGDGGCRVCNHVTFSFSTPNTIPVPLTCISSSEICSNGFFKLLVNFHQPDYLSRLPDYLIKNDTAINVLEFWYINYTNKNAAFGSICVPCDPLCNVCVDGSRYCSRCTLYKLDGRCVEDCPLEYFSASTTDIDNSTSNQCLRCNEECDGGCFGPSTDQCFGCRHVKVFINESNNEFYCNSSCGNLYQITYKSEQVCVITPDLWSSSWIQISAITCSVSVVVFCSFAVVISVFASVHRKKTFDKKQIKLDEFYQPQSESLVGIQPNMATLLLITESQLTRGDIIGSGAFGVVYKAIWQPNLDKIDKSTSFLKRNLAKYSRESSIKLLVAVKVLTDISDPTNNMQLLEEAKVMASVNHPCCLRILGLCLTAHPQLITQFMPLGSLLEFCQKQSAHISNVTMLNWAKQIAHGMEYLESKIIIHCDLAARNVLVQSPKQVKITDFGLAKILDESQHQYQSKGGRMPIKWLAIESIKHRVFSSKSDVWSFGVTLWEMFTFGEKPFQNIKAVEILNHLEKGQRLSQPKICSIDVYALLVQCWLVDAESRPSFSDLKTSFEMMANNPNRYLLIQSSPEIDSIYSGLEDDALQYDEFLQSLVTVPQLNPDYESLDQSNSGKRNVKSVRNRYREMLSYRNSFVNYANEWRNHCHATNNDYTSITEKDETYDQSLSMWSEISRENRCLSNATLLTRVNSPSDYTSSTHITNSGLSDDGYLIPQSRTTLQSNLQSSQTLPLSETESGVVFSCGVLPEKEILVGHESSL